MELKCHDQAECHQMEVSRAKFPFLHSKPTVILFCKYYRGVYYCFHLFMLLHHLRAVLTGEFGLCCALSTSKGQRNEIVNSLARILQRQAATDE